MFFSRVLVASALLGLSGLVRADTCEEVDDRTSIEVRFPLELAYIDEQNDYWSTSCAALRPSCIIFPKTASEMALAIRILRNNTENFAIKSGGHSPNSYFASIDDGPLISTQRLDQVLLDLDTGVVTLGPGNRLDEVAKELDGTGWTVVGGRIGNTGIGGLILGGGLSYMSAQYGWTSSTVIQYEIVLANGTVTNASATQNPDLYRALKGGGNNFGVVTSYTLQALQQGDIWGGNLFFAHTDKIGEQLLQAVADFTLYNPDPKAAVILTAERAGLDLVDSWIMFVFYDGPSPPDGIFSNFTDVGPIANTARRRSYADLIAASNWVVLPGVQVQMATETVPLSSSANSSLAFNDIYQHWRDVSDESRLVPGIIASIAFQPFPRDIARHALESGGDLIDCDDTVDRLIIELNYQFLLPASYSRMDELMQETYGGVRELVLEYQADGTLPEAYLPVFANYGYFRQDYWGRIRPASRTFAREVAQAYDPQGLFRTRTGGWKP
ncbi:hypothetical protein S40285_08446 [Stachybotrys chlorohalonatus IBT 40285]|uniref:FAD-binding PCMH-type domain-containing protein n=1 Tax=Stachybotrys chlorohalonatus (strain IBT 40285) TaxID=1283841 RepID=A0A084QQE7_STAC4|nr:hypothetical protein S40285_08446 [Stachybotrys chlorohalonata IBT 40285]